MKRLIQIIGLVVVLFGASQANAKCLSNANFNYSIDQKDSSLYTFYDSSAGGPYFRNIWYFGDGTSSAGGSSSIQHRYSSNGSYTVCHVVTDTTQTCTDTTCIVIQVGGRDNSCRADFSAIVQFDSVTFTNKSTQATNYYWIFGDGVGSYLKSPVHVYQVKQIVIYNVCLVIFDTTSSCSDTICQSITVYPSPACKASFTYTSKDLQFAFTNTSQNSTSYFWDFGDGDTANQLNPTHTYKKETTYSVCLSVKDTFGCEDSVCETVDAFINRCKSNFVLAIDTAQKFKLYLLNRSSNLASHSYQWDFGDGAISTQRNPSHQYATFGAYKVCLIVSDTLNKCSSAFCDTVGLDSNGKLLKAGFELEIIEDIFFSVPKKDVLKTSIYPNPVTNILNFRLDDYEPIVTIEINTIAGVKAFEQNFNGIKEESIDVSSLLDGMYILSISTPTSSARVRFIKIQ